MSEQKFLTIDIGSAWSKAFLVAGGTGSDLEIEKSLRLPTSWGDLGFAIEQFKNELDVENATTLVVSHLPEVAEIAKKQKVEYIGEKDAATALVKFFKKNDFQVTVLDGGASNLLETIEAEEIGKFLTFQSSSIFLENFFGKKRFRTHILPTDVKELEIEEAFLRTIFQNKLANQNITKKMLIVTTGGAVSGTPRFSRLALLILDSLPAGATAQVLFDREFFLPCFGALLVKYKQMGLSTPGVWLENLGGFVSLGGLQRVDLDWGYSQIQQVELSENEISIVPAPKEQKIKLSLPISKKEKREFNINGGNLGVVLDSRPKPLPLSFGQGESRNLMGRWLKDLEQAEINKEIF